MFKTIIKEAIDKIIEDTKLVRLSFLIGFGHCVSIIYIIAWNINNLLTYRYEKGISMGKAIEYIFNRSQANSMTITLIITIIVIFLRYFLIYPMGEAAIVHYLKGDVKKIGKAIGKGISDFFVMFEYGALVSTFSVFMYSVTILRLFMLDILDNVIVIIILLIWGIAVLLASTLWSYAKFIIVLEGLPVFAALKRSAYLSIMHFGTTIKFVFLQLFLTIRFFLNAAIVIGIPFLIVYFAIMFDIIESSFIEYFILIVVVLLLLFVTYINGIIEAFFNTYRFKVYQKIISEETKEK